MNRRSYWSLGLLGAALVTAAEPPPKNPPEPSEVSADSLYEAGKDLFDALAPPEVKEQFEFPDRAQWDAFLSRLQAALAGDDPAALAQLEPDARAVLTTLRTIPGSEEY